MAEVLKSTQNKLIADINNFIYSVSFIFFITNFISLSLNLCSILNDLSVSDFLHTNIKRQKLLHSAQETAYHE